MFAIPWDFDFFVQPVGPYYLHEGLTLTIELNKPEKVLLCSSDTAAINTVSDVALEYDTIIDAAY